MFRRKNFTFCRFLTLIVSLSLTYCSPKGGSGGSAPIAKPSNGVFVTSVNMVSDSPSGTVCATGKHDYPNLSEYCLGIQQSAWNNDCAQQSREDQFRIVCPSQDWTPDDTEQKWAALNGAKITCFAGHKSKNGDKPNDNSIQGTASSQLTLEQTDFKMVVTKSGSNQSVLMTIDVQDLNGNSLAKQSQTWDLSTEALPSPFTVEAIQKSAVATCVSGIVY